MTTVLRRYEAERGAAKCEVRGYLHALLQGAAYFVMGLLFLLAATPASLSQTAMMPSQPLITQPINEANLVVLAGNTHSKAKNVTDDLGLVPDSLAMPHMMLQLRRPPAQEQALETLIGQLHDPSSPNYHHWLTATQFGAQFGPATSDVSAVTGWLQRHGFTVNSVAASKMVIDYSGTAGQVRAAFHTQIHYFNVNGVTRFANINDPAIPAALAPAVVGVASLHNIPPKPLHVNKPQYTFAGCGNTCYAMVPTDLATIYNFNPIFAGGNTGQGQTIYLIEDSDLYSNSDWTTFRSTFGLSGYTGASLTTIHPAPTTGPSNCSDPGTNDDDGEAILDSEWASAAAPSAMIVLATCADTATFGGLTAIQNLVDSASPPAIISMSYGNCEADNGTSTNAAFNSIYEQGVAEGTSIFVSAGDGDAAGCDDFNTAQAAAQGIAVSGFASTPYNVAVGGTDFSDTYSGTNSSYWTTTNTVTFGSALSYVPEMPWNDSCGSQLISTFLGFSTPYGPSGLCNSATAGQAGLLTIAGGSGGPSQVYTKPSWQSGLFGNPADGVRDLPDVSLFAANGLWGHYYVFCWSDPGQSSNGSAPCTAAPSGWSSAGGTSFAAPIWAGIQALINDKSGGPQGLPNYRLYQLAVKEYGTSGSSTCNSSNGNTVAASCVFYDVTLGDNDADCTSGSPNCYDPGGTYGVLSTSISSYAPAYKTQAGWDFATGIGTINVANLVNAWVGGGMLLTDSHDFNADGKSDILWRDSNSGEAAIWEMNGSSALASGGVGAVPSNWQIVGTGDFNGDGRADLLWRDANTGTVAIWEMNGLSALASSGVGGVPSNWQIVGTGDFNGDGKSDILWRDSNSGEVAIWEMNGFSVLATGGIGAEPSNWQIVGTGDFNGDGKSDILWRDSNTGTVAIWEMNGFSVLPASGGVGGVSSNWRIVGTGDFNGDGNSDILWSDSNTGTVAIWEMNGLTVLASGGIGGETSNWQIIETGDFNGDGKSDILWRDSNSGTVAIWEMNGLSVLASFGIGGVTSNWQIQSMNTD